MAWESRGAVLAENLGLLPSHHFYTQTSPKQAQNESIFNKRREEDKSDGLEPYLGRVCQSFAGIHSNLKVPWSGFCALGSLGGDFCQSGEFLVVVSMFLCVSQREWRVREGWRGRETESEKKKKDRVRERNKEMQETFGRGGVGCRLHLAHKTSHKRQIEKYLPNVKLPNCPRHSMFRRIFIATLNSILHVPTHSYRQVLWEYVCVCVFGSNPNNN